MICYSCKQNDSIDKAKYVFSNGEIHMLDFCVHCIQPIYEITSRFVKQVEYEEIKTQ